MTYLLVGAAILVLLVWRGRTARGTKAAPWRAPVSILSYGLLAGAAFEAVRGGIEPAGLLLAGAATLLFAARRRPARPAEPQAGADGNMSLVEARATLGVAPDAKPDDIRAAYARLIRIAHPDRGGTAGLAAQLNAARDRLLRK